MVAMTPRWLVSSGKRTLNLLTRGKEAFLFGHGLYLRAAPPATVEFSQLELRFDIPNLEVFQRFSLFRNRSRPTFVGETALLISGFGRFGNMVIQICNIALIAEQLGIDTVFYWRNSYFAKREIKIGPKFTLKHASIKGVKALPKPKTLIRTRAFSGAQIPPGLSPELLCTIRNALNAEVFPANWNTEQTPEDALVVHMRSGDVFWPNPHPEYGQPPLSFYQKVLRHRAWSSVVIVAEDETNPCLQGLKDLCGDRGIPVTVRGLNFEDALVTIASARNIAASRGTFISAICWLAPATRNIYYLGTKPPEAFPLEEARFFLVSDRTGEYEEAMLRGNWKNTQDQRNLMLTHPESSLDIRPQSTAES